MYRRVMQYAAAAFGVNLFCFVFVQGTYLNRYLILAVIFFVPALPVGVTVIVLNAPLFLMSLKRFGKRFLVRSFFAVAVNSLFIDLINAVCTFLPMD